MVRMLVMCSMVLAIASCRGDKKSFRTVSLSNGDVQVVEVAEEPSQKKDETPIQKQLKEDDAKVTAERKKAEITAAVKQLKLMLDASIRASNPMRVAGIVTANKTADIHLRDEVPDSLLYATLEQSTTNNSFKEIQERAGKKLSIKFESRARLVSTGSELETIKAINLLLANPEETSQKNRIARIPFAVELSPDFFKSEPSIDRKDFYAVLATNGEGRYSHFNLHDKVSLKEVGKVSLTITDSQEVKDQKMIVEFIEDGVERVIPLQLQLVNFLRN